MIEVPSLETTRKIGFLPIREIERCGPFRALITTRQGGLSQPPYDSFNMSLNVGDETSFVMENRWRLAQHLETDLQHLIALDQVHSDIIYTEISPGLAGDPGDGLFVSEPGFFAVISVADCVPIYLADPKRRIIGVIHAGWRGLDQQIATKAIIKMQSTFRSNPEQIQAVIGPSIGPCHYQVGQEVVAAFEEQIGFESIFYEERNDKLFLNLWAIAHHQLMNAGVYPGHIVLMHQCTACQTELYFSHRASGGRTGRMWAVVGLKKD